MKRIMSVISLMCATSLMSQTYRIEGPLKPLPHELTAMKELKEYLARRVKGTLSVGGRHSVVFQVGDTALAKANNLLSTQLPDEQWVIKSFGKQVLLNGGGTRGALYATYHFLEDYCDVHWWSEFEDYVPSAGPLLLPSLNASGKPAYLYRDIYRGNHGPNSSQFAIRVRLNRNGDIKIPKEFGGAFNYGPPYHCHTFDKYVPASKYLAEHPEYFSLRDGVRVGGQTKGQLCLSNPGLRKIFLENLLKYIEQGEEMARRDGVPAPRIYDVSENDNRNCCQCPACNAFAEKYGQSGLYLTFINWLAGEVAKTRPDVYISTLAYFYTEPPPKGGIKAAPNVIVKLTDTQTNQAASILEPENKVFKDFVEGWKSHAKHLFIWDYAITYTRRITGFPFASEFHYGDLYKFYHANNVSGIFWEHESQFMADMFELKFFLETKLFEDPSQDVNKLINLFMNKYYGAAGPFVLQYRQRLDKARKDVHAVVRWFPSHGAFGYLTADVLRECQDILDRGEAAVRGDALLLARVRTARRGIDRYACSLSPALYHGSNPPPESQFDGKAAYKRISESWPKWVAHFPDPDALMREISDEMESYGHVYNKTLQPPVEFKDRNMFDFQADSFESHDKKSVVRVKDPESPVGSAMRTTVAGNHYYNMPFGFGFYDAGAAKGLAYVTQPKLPAKKGYNWYRLGVVKIPEDGYVYVTRAWTTKLQTGRPELVRKTFEIYISAKLSGPQFYADETGPDYIWVDRIILLEPLAQK